MSYFPVKAVSVFLWGRRPFRGGGEVRDRHRAQGACARPRRGSGTAVRSSASPGCTRNSKSRPCDLQGHFAIIHLFG